MKAEIIMIGTELLLGQIVDTNASYLARQLATLGIDVFRKTTVGDNEQRIVNAIRKALNRCDVVITSGGIGPTVDDKTREAVAKATDQSLVLNTELLEFVSNFFKRRGLELGENNKRQAYIPENAIPIENPVGTAPGFIVEKNGSCVMSLPGVPRELYYLTEHTVLPYIKKKFGIQTIIKIRTLRTAGIGESNIDRMIDAGRYAPTGYNKQPVRFAAEALAGKPTSWRWDFGDGASATGQTASHTFAQPGERVPITIPSDLGMFPPCS